MKFDKKQLKLYAITPTGLTPKEYIDQTKAALKGGITMLQLRLKGEQKENKVKIATALKTLCNEYKVPFIINDDINLAIQVDSDGVHLGESDCSIKEARLILGQDKIIGATSNSLKRSINAQLEGADYLGIGAIFPSKSKPLADTISLEELRAQTKATELPVVAIGGITSKNIHKLKDTNIAGVSIINDIFNSEQIENKCKNLFKEIETIIGLKTALTIAGSDCSGGAGIQADLKTFHANHVYGMSVITALTAQNTLGVKSILNVSPKFLEEQLDAIFKDIKPNAVKIGMVSNKNLIQIIINKLKEYNALNIVVDPVMVATSGSKLLDNDAIDTLANGLFPLATVITPNIPEAELLTGHSIKNKKDMEKVAKIIGDKYDCAVLCKGGHRIEDANDVLYHSHQFTWFESERINNQNTHGTGCTLSSAIAANLAKNYDLVMSIKRSKHYLILALKEQLNLGHGHGPLNHLVDICQFQPFNMTKGEK